MYLRTLKALQDLQTAAASPPEPAPQSRDQASEPNTPVSDSPFPVPTQPHAPPIGFVSQSAPAHGERPRLLTPVASIEIDLSAPRRLGVEKSLPSSPADERPLALSSANARSRPLYL
jgi:hypothetical protein